jgi:Fe-S cluster biogenesis protein NfuA
MGISESLDKDIATIEHVLQSLRPTIQQDGGDIEFIKFENRIVFVRMHGACVGCPASFFTLKFAVEQALKDALPDILEVEQID